MIRTPSTVAAVLLSQNESDSLPPECTQMVAPELHDLSARLLLDGLRSGELSATSLTEAALDRAEGGSVFGAFTHLARDSALSNAARCDGHGPSSFWRRPLNGLPIVVKDNIDVVGMPTTAGSLALADNVPRRSASAVQRLVNAGAVVLGKTNLHEFAFGITNNNAAYGPARNPYALERITGGSSGGTAAAIAARIAAVGLGTDTGGSLRIPAALCGVVGFRPTSGRWPNDGVVPISATRDTVGPMARTVSDCALLDAVVCGESLSLPPATLYGVRIGIPRRYFWGDLDPVLARVAQDTLRRMASAGVDLVECDVGIDGGECTQAGMVIAVAETMAGLKRYFESHGLPFDPQRLAAAVASPDVRAVFGQLLGPNAPTQAAYESAMSMRAAYQVAYANCFASYRIEALVFPTTPLPAALIGEDDTVQLLGQAVSTFFTYTRNAGPSSIVGIPSISLPIGLDDGGLPLGVELDGPHGTDRRLLALAASLEALLPGLPAPPTPTSRTTT